MAVQDLTDAELETLLGMLLAESKLRSPSTPDTSDIVVCISVPVDDGERPKEIDENHH